jgi:hypothetical protein
MTRMRLPEPRGPLSEGLLPVLAGPPRLLPKHLNELAGGDGPDPVSDDDLQITLFACYGLHYLGFAEVHDDWEWYPPLLELRRVLESRFEQALRSRVAPLPQVSAEQLPGYLLRPEAPLGPSLAGHMQRTATVEHFREFAIHRSLYNLMEADPHSWALPRVSGRAKCALVEIQADEYGNGVPGRMHCELYAQMMVALRLDPGYGHYVDRVPASSLALLNALTLFGLHRRLRGALLGNLAVSEIGSSASNRCFSRGLQRLGADTAARLFFDEHVEADAVHEQIATYSMCGAFVAEFPAELAAVVFGAQVTRELKRLSNEGMLTSWQHDVSSLRPGRD